MKVKVLRSWLRRDNTWTTPGEIIGDLEHPEAYMEAGLVIPVRELQIEYPTMDPPEKTVTR